MRTLVFLIAMAVAAFGQRHKVPEDVDAQKPEGQMMQAVLQESDAVKKTALMEQFAQQYPKSEFTPWILDQLLAGYVKANDADKVLSTGGRILALDPGDPEAPMQCLKIAEAKNDLDGIKKWSETASVNARKIAEAPQPKEADEVEHWKNDVSYARQVDAYTDYALYRVAATTRDPKIMIDFANTLEKHNAKSEYVPKLQESLFVAYRQAGQNDKALALAEKVLATEQTNEDMLLVVADNYLQTRKDPEKVHAYSARLVELMASKPKPEGVSDADWTARRNQITGLAHYMSGKLYYTEKKYPQAEKELHAALPTADSNQTMKAEVLFELAFANYKMEKPQEAANYYRECANIKSPFQADAAKSLKGIQTQYHGVK